MSLEMTDILIVTRIILNQRRAGDILFRLSSLIDGVTAMMRSTEILTGILVKVLFKMIHSS